MLLVKMRVKLPGQMQVTNVLNMISNMLLTIRSTRGISCYLCSYILVKTGEFDGRTPLHEASLNGNLEFVKYLVNQGAVLDAGVNEEGTLKGATPLILSCKEGNLKVIRYLIDSGADIRKQAKNGLDCASWAIFNNKIDVLKHILPIYPDLIRRKLLKGRNLLHLSVWKGRLASAIVILKNEGNKAIEEQDEEGNTALGIASYYGRLPIVKLLVQNGANINHIGYHNKNVIDLAKWKGHSDVVDYLSQFRKNKNVFHPIIQ